MRSPPVSKRKIAQKRKKQGRKIRSERSKKARRDRESERK
jgi:hypothetical protein